jgi:hypothetical protein
MSFTNTYENHVMDYVFTSTSVTRPTAWYIGLFTADPTDAGTQTSEVSGNGYARTSVTFSVTADTATNSAAVEFPAASGGNWGTITHIGVLTASSAGDMIVHSALTTAKAINDGDVFRIPTGDLDITLD